jgi:hypothetical protein
MRDLPTAPALLALARDVLLGDLLPLLPPEARLDARLVANSMAIAEREALAGEGPAGEIARELKLLYGGALTHPAQAVEREAGEGERDVMRRFANDLRTGAFEGSDREARDILWRLTLAKLRQANPRFLAANGFS